MPFEQGHALLIGVGTHQYGEVPDVPATVADARALESVLKDPTMCGYLTEQVHLIHDDETSKARILKELDWLATTKPSQTVVVFYSGHGGFGNDGKYYLFSHDARRTGNQVVQGTGVSEDELIAKLRAIPAERVLMIFNACHSGTMSLELTSLSTTNPTETQKNALLGTGKGRILMAACGDDQVSYVGSGELTIFTETLVKGLRGGAVHNNGYVGVYGLFEYTADAVSAFVKQKHNKTQEPQIQVVEGRGIFPIALYRGATTLGTFDEQEPLPDVPGVTQVPERTITRIQKRWSGISTTNQSGGVNTQNQSGGVNFGGSGDISIGGDVVGRDKIIRY